MPAIWRISLILPTSRTDITTVAAKEQFSSLRGVMNYGGFIFDLHAVYQSAIITARALQHTYVLHKAEK
jgi:hypothetical protein